MAESAIDQEMVDLYHEYVHAPLKRRIFLARLLTLTGSEEKALTTAKLLDAEHARGALVPSERASRAFGKGAAAKDKVY